MLELCRNTHSLLVNRLNDGCGGESVMAHSLLEKVMNYILPSTAEEDSDEADAKLQLVSSPTMSFFVAMPRNPEKTCEYADSLRGGMVLLVEYQDVDAASRQTMHDFLRGVCYVLGGQAQVVSSDVILYLPAEVDVSCLKAEAQASFRQVFPFDSVQ